MMDTFYREAAVPAALSLDDESIDRELDMYLG
jgi:hypothetical protein